jgi:hypothetical protein
MQLTPGGGDGGPTLGVRGGWVLSPIHGDWSLDGREILGGPDLGITGPYVRLFIGFGSLGRHD